MMIHFPLHTKLPWHGIGCTSQEYPHFLTPWSWLAGKSSTRLQPTTCLSTATLWYFSGLIVVLPPEDMELWIWLLPPQLWLKCTYTICGLAWDLLVIHGSDNILPHFRLCRTLPIYRDLSLFWFWHPPVIFHGKFHSLHLLLRHFVLCFSFVHIWSSTFVRLSCNHTTDKCWFEINVR